MSECNTLPEMLKLKEGEQIDLPAEFIEALKLEAVPKAIEESNSLYARACRLLGKLKPKDVEGPNAIMILNPATKVVRVLPTKGPAVHKLTLEIDELSPDFLHDLGKVYLRNKVRSLYMNGFMDSATLELYIDSAGLRIPQGQLKDELSEMRGVNKVELQTLVL